MERIQRSEYFLDNVGDDAGHEQAGAIGLAGEGDVQLVSAQHLERPDISRYHGMEIVTTGDPIAGNKTETAGSERIDGNPKDVDYGGGTVVDADDGIFNPGGIPCDISIDEHVDWLEGLLMLGA